MTLESHQGDDGTPWMKILDNILKVVDPQKIESSTNGQWRAAIARCLELSMAKHG